MAPMVSLAKLRPLIRPENFKSISTFIHLRQEAQLVEPPVPPHEQSPLPPNPARGSPYYNPSSIQSDMSLIPVSHGIIRPSTSLSMKVLSALRLQDLMDLFGQWTAEQKWSDMKQAFESWLRMLDRSGQPNKPSVDLYNQYLRANLMLGASAAGLLDLVVYMENFNITPNTASFNIVLESMAKTGEDAAATKLIQRMLETGKENKESLPDHKSYDIVLRMLFDKNRIDSALKYVDLILKSGYVLSMEVFRSCVASCVRNRWLDTLVSIIEKCKTSDENKHVCPSWPTSCYIADVATQSDNSELAYLALDFMIQWINKGEKAWPPLRYSIDEGLVVSMLGTAARTYNAELVDHTWYVLKRSLHQKVLNPECYIGKINAYANIGNLQKAFITLHDFETKHGNSNQEDGEGFFSPFYSLNPLVIACSKKGFRTLDAVYFQLENLSKATPPYKSVAALNCIILGCANTWDVDRAYQTFSAIDGTFGLSPDIHSYNSLICAFGKLGKRDEAVKVFEHFVGLGVQPNMTTYSLLIDAHLIQRDPKAALSVVDDMIQAGYQPSREMLKKIRRRCIREMDYESNDKIEPIARQFNIKIGTEVRRDILFNLQYSTDYA